MAMIWTGCISLEMVDGWTQEQVSLLLATLNDAVETVFEEVEQNLISENPLVRLAIGLL